MNNIINHDMFLLGWEPARTIVFCSFGLEDVENYSPESWISRHINVVKQRTIVYTNIAEPVQGTYL